MYAYYWCIVFAISICRTSFVWSKAHLFNLDLLKQKDTILFLCNHIWFFVYCKDSLFVYIFLLSHPNTLVLIKKVSKLKDSDFLPNRQNTKLLWKISPWKHGAEKFRIRPLFTQCRSLTVIYVVHDIKNAYWNSHVYFYKKQCNCRAMICSS